jgi:hypothetical protein
LRGGVEGRKARRLTKAALKRCGVEALPGGACPLRAKNGSKGATAETIALLSGFTTPQSRP